MEWPDVKLASNGKSLYFFASSAPIQTSQKRDVSRDHFTWCYKVPSGIHYHMDRATIVQSKFYAK
ncbi:MAG: hypothetical protein KDD20_04450 [Mangrovimonas sp.]|nr:hypothetical protein [Mangrovimonas sp.]